MSTPSVAKPAVEILTIGSELLMGLIQDTNSHWLAQRLAECGVNLARVTMLPDEAQSISEAVSAGLGRGADYLLVCGGLGPTPDDLTVEAVAGALGLPTEVDEPTLDDYVRRRNLNSRGEITPGLRKMATVPAGAAVYPNPAGWAPCTVLRRGHAFLIILPGPPKELQAVFTMHVADLLRERSRERTASLRVTVNMHESEVSPLLQQVMEREPGTYLKAYVAMRDTFDQGLPVDVVATAGSQEAAHDVLERAVSALSELVTASGRQIDYVSS